MPSKKSKTSPDSKAAVGTGRGMKSLYLSTRTTLSGPAQLMASGLGRSLVPKVELTDDVMLDIRKNMKPSKVQVKRLAGTSRKAEQGKLPVSRKVADGVKAGSRQADGKRKSVGVGSSPLKGEAPEIAKADRRMSYYRGTKRSPKGTAESKQQVSPAEAKKSPTSKKQKTTPSPKSKESQKSSKKSSAESKLPVPSVTRKSPVIQQKEMASPKTVRKQRGTPSPKSSPKSPKSTDTSPVHSYNLRSVPFVEPTELTKTENVQKGVQRSKKSSSASRSAVQKVVEDSTKSEVRGVRVTKSRVETFEVEDTVTPIKPRNKRKLEEPVEESDNPPVRKKQLLTSVKKASGKDVTDFPFSTPLPTANYNITFEGIVSSSVGTTIGTVEFLKVPPERTSDTPASILTADQNTASERQVLAADRDKNHTERLTRSHATDTGIFLSKSSTVDRDAPRTVNWDTSEIKKSLLNSIPRVTRRRNDDTLAGTVGSLERVSLWSSERTTTTVSSTGHAFNNDGASNDGTSCAAYQDPKTTEGACQSTRRRRACSRFCQCLMLLGIPLAVTVGMLVTMHGENILHYLMTLTNNTV